MPTLPPRYRTKYHVGATLLMLLLLPACGTAPPPCPPLQLDPQTVSVISADWHSDIAIPVDELDNSLRPIAAQFPGARMLLFGYGKKTFMTAPPGTFSKYFTGPIPGPAAIEVTALNTSLADAYKAEDFVTLPLPPGGAHTLSLFIRHDMTNNPDGTPQEVMRWDDPPIVVYAANSRYTFLHTCNGWAADALAEAGVPLSPSRVVTSGRLMSRAREAEMMCQGPVE